MAAKGKQFYLFVLMVLVTREHLKISKIKFIPPCGHVIPSNYLKLGCSFKIAKWRRKPRFRYYLFIYLFIFNLIYYYDFLTNFLKTTVNCLSLALGHQTKLHPGTKCSSLLVLNREDIDDIIS